MKIEHFKYIMEVHLFRTWDVFIKVKQLKSSLFCTLYYFYSSLFIVLFFNSEIPICMLAGHLAQVRETLSDVYQD